MLAGRRLPVAPQLLRVDHVLRAPHSYGCERCAAGFQVRDGPALLQVITQACALAAAAVNANRRFVDSCCISAVAGGQSCAASRARPPVCLARHASSIITPRAEPQLYLRVHPRLSPHAASTCATRRFCRNPYVTSKAVRSYLGAPLVSSTGHRLGTM